MTTISHAKFMAKSLRASLSARGKDVSHSESLELVAAQLGYRDWNTLAARLDTLPSLESGITVLRIFSIEDATAFYVDYLGMSVDWEHRFEPGMPLYFQVSRSNLTLHLSQHHGDGSPGAAVWIPVGDVHALHAELREKRYDKLKPGVEADAPGGPTMTLIDPFFNILRLCQPNGLLASEDGYSVPA